MEFKTPPEAKNPVYLERYKNFFYDVFVKLRELIMQFIDKLI
jgi:hypothetical protein